MAFNIAGFGETFGFKGWNLGISAIGNMFLWFILSIFLFGLILAGIIFWIWRRSYKYKIIVVGKVGNNVQEIHWDRAKRLPVGRAGDMLFFLGKWKRLIPRPTLYIGTNKFLFFEREDGELINIEYEDLNKKQRELGIKFVETDMRMQRLGIERILQHRHQRETWWEQHGQTVINVVFYVIVTMMLIILFIQWRKTAGAIAGAVSRAGEVMDRAIATEEVSPHVPEEDGSGGSGLIPALILVSVNKYRIWKLRK